jgi:hypothetical protein
VGGIAWAASGGWQPVIREKVWRPVVGPGKRTHVTCGAQLSPVSALVLATLASDASAPITSRTHLPKKTEVITLEHLSA